MTAVVVHWLVPFAGFLIARLPDFSYGAADLSELTARFEMVAPLLPVEGMSYAMGLWLTLSGGWGALWMVRFLLKAIAVVRGASW